MKPLAVWDEADLQMLIASRLNETIGREYKQTFSLDRPSDRKELCKDVSGFANSQGGFIVFGLQEAHVDGSGSVPVALSPIVDKSLKEKAEQILVDGIAPRIDFRIYSFPDSRGTGEYVLCEIPKSYRGVHMVTYDKDNRYYIRRNFQTVPMTPFEVDDAYRTFLKLEDSNTFRLSQFQQTQFPNVLGPDNWGAWISVLAIPTFPMRDIFAPICFLAHEVAQFSVGMRTSNGLPGIDSFGPSFEGLTSLGVRSDGVTVYNHTIFRDGAVRTGYCIMNRSSKLVGALQVLEYIHNSVAFIVGVFERAGYASHLLFRFSVSFNSDYDLGVPEFAAEADWNPDRRTPAVYSFSRDLSFSFSEWKSAAPNTLEPLWHHFWQSLGYSRCYYYDGSTGNYDQKLVNERVKWVKP